MLEGKWALVVEDDAHSLVAISSILRDLGIRFKRNTTGENVDAQIRSMAAVPDFVLLSAELAAVDAFAIVRRLKSDPAARSIPVIALGSANDFRTLKNFRRAGFAAYLPKPLPRRQFGDLVERILNGEAGWEASI